jgi:hypothetical protein
MQALIQTMFQTMNDRRFEVPEKPLEQTAAGKADFSELFGDAAKAATQSQAPPAAPAASVSDPLGDPDVQGWLTGFYAEEGAPSASANTSYQPAAGAVSNYPAGSIYGPDAIYAQAFANQAGNAFAGMTGDNPAQFTSQLPGVPSQQAQQEFDRRLAQENLGRLQSGQPIDTTAYWSDPGSITTGGVTYTSKQLGYAGPAQSSGPQPIYISDANRTPGTDTFSVGGYAGTVKGIQPGRYYTLQQLEQAGLPKGQPDGQFHPGSWTTSQEA